MTLKLILIKVKYTKYLYFYILVTIMGITILTLYRSKPKIYLHKDTIVTPPIWEASLGLITPLPSLNFTKKPKIFSNKYSDLNRKNEYNKISFNHTIKTNSSFNNFSVKDKLKITNETYFAKRNTLPKCGISSFPGSGNTWLRRLIEAATGLFTGSQYDDGNIYLNGYFGELDPWDTGTTIVQKTHMVSETVIKALNNRGIFVLRNPYRAILSLHNFMFGGHQMFAPIINYRRKDWPAFLHLQIKNWLQTAINWVTIGKEVLVIHYENLVRNPVEELRKILKFLQVLPDEERLECIQKNNFLEFKRNEEFFPDSLTIFPNKTRDKMDRAIRYVSFLLEKYGHEKSPLQLYEFYNNTFSDKIKLIPCTAEETFIECDARVDDMNSNFRKTAYKLRATNEFITEVIKFVTKATSKQVPHEKLNVSRNRTSFVDSVNEL